MQATDHPRVVADDAIPRIAFAVRETDQRCPQIQWQPPPVRQSSQTSVNHRRIQGVLHFLGCRSVRNWPGPTPDLTGSVLGTADHPPFMNHRDTEAPPRSQDDVVGNVLSASKPALRQSNGPQVVVHRHWNIEALLQPIHHRHPFPF